MATKKVLKEVEITQCDFCEKIVSDDCWGPTCNICGKDLCDNHLIRPIKGEFFTVCPNCNKLDLSDIFNCINERSEADAKYRENDKRLKERLVYLKNNIKKINGIL